jgi:hypothetical protein
VGRFFCIDPLFREYPHNSSYAFSENVVINSVELEGLEKDVAIDNTLGKNKKDGDNYHLISGEQARGDSFVGPLIQVLNDEKLIGDYTSVKMTLIGFTSVKRTTGPWWWRSTDHHHLAKYDIHFIYQGAPITIPVQIETGASTHVDGSNPLDYILIGVGSKWVKVMESSIVQNAKRQVVKHFTDILAKNGVKYNMDDIVRIGRNQSGGISFIETGTENAGLKHILSAHGDDFVKNGIAKKDVADFVFDASTKGKIVGYQGKGQERPIYEYLYKGKTKRVAVTTGSNGFIVGANPVSIK